MRTSNGSSVVTVHACEGRMVVVHMYGGTVRVWGIVVCAYGGTMVVTVQVTLVCEGHAVHAVCVTGFMGCTVIMCTYGGAIAG